MPPDNTLEDPSLQDAASLYVTSVTLIGRRVLFLLFKVNMIKTELC